MNSGIIKFTVLSLAVISILQNVNAQEDDLLKLVGEDKPKKEFVDYAFKSSRVINSHSMEMIKPGVMDLRILHRFGAVNKGFYELFGLDNATMRMGFDFGITKNFMLGIGRTTQQKEFDVFGKYRLIHQSKGPGSLPFSFLITGGVVYNSLKWTDTSRKNYLSSRFSYYGQAILGRKFGESVTLQFMPTIVHRNLVNSEADPADLYAVGVGSRIKLSKRISLNVDYYHRLNPNPADGTLNPFSVGFDIETGGHIFQLHFTNASGMNEKSFLTQTTNNWGNGDIQFGFNISRTFQLKKKKH